MNRSFQTFWKWTTQTRPLWYKDPKEGIIACGIFGLTGTTTLALVRPTMENVFGMKGSMIDGPNSYRVISLLCISPIYALMLGAVGTVAGRHNYFAKMSIKIFCRFIPKKVVEKAVCPPAKANKH